MLYGKQMGSESAYNDLNLLLSRHCSLAFSARFRRSTLFGMMELLCSTRLWSTRQDEERSSRIKYEALNSF